MCVQPLLQFKCTDRFETCHCLQIMQMHKWLQYSVTLISVTFYSRDHRLSNSYTMGSTPVRGDNPRALASGLSYVHVDKHGITILYHLHPCRPCTS